MSKVIKHPMYEEMQDTPWITQARSIADVGGKGVLANADKVNVFSDDTKKSLEARNNDVYNRAFNDMSREYTNSMNKYAASNYNRFGSLNSTPSSFITDDYQRQYQRQMDDAAYNKAANYEDLVNNELQRRYDTLNMYDKLYDYGKIPYQQDVDNWKLRNLNKDVAYSNEIAKQTAGGGWKGMLKGGITGAAAGYQSGGWKGALIGGTVGSSMGAIPQQSVYYTGNSTTPGYGVLAGTTPNQGLFDSKTIGNSSGLMGTFGKGLGRGSFGRSGNYTPTSAGPYTIYNYPTSSNMGQGYGGHTIF